MSAPTTNEELAFRSMISECEVRLVPAGDLVFNAGQSFSGLFMLRTGSAKHFRVRPDGSEQVIGFPLPGELIGAETIGSNTHQSSLVALEMCSVVVIEHNVWRARLEQEPMLADYLYRRFAKYLKSCQDWCSVVGRASAESKVAAFLLDYSQRLAARGYSEKEFVLKMTRADIGCFLGLTLETVSRSLSRLQNDGTLKIHYRNIEICNMSALVTLAMAG
jgi:CRP/FNR family transcriptional regulator, anaerobic regulatory protein